jgi:hypothetical protein
MVSSGTFLPNEDDSCPTCSPDDDDVDVVVIVGTIPAPTDEQVSVAIDPFLSTLPFICGLESAHIVTSTGDTMSDTVNRTRM